MQHIPEHTLELYVLDSGSVAGERAEIEAHLAVCHGCRAAEAAMRSFYEEAGRALEEVRSAGDPAGEALVRAERSLRPLFTELGPVERPLRSVTPLGKMQIFIRRHPVAAGSGVLAGIAAAMLGVFMLRPPAPGPPNPAVVLPNFQTGRLEVYDAQDVLLWSLPSSDISLVQAHARSSSRDHILAQAKVADLDGDGRREVITTLPLGSETQAESLRVFTADKTIRWACGFQDSTPSTIGVYTETLFLAGTLLVLPDRVGTGVSIFVQSSNRHSPSRIVRLNSRGVELGKYWHFGQFRILAADPDRDGRMEIVAYGLQDTAVVTNREQPFLAILDPGRIVGETRSSATPYFALPSSDAEEYYIRLPLTDIHRAVRVNATADEFTRESDSLFSILAITAERVPSFRFWFNHRMEALQVKTGNPTELLHAQLRREGRLTSTMGPEYLEDVRRRVRYWDGSAWRAEPVRVTVSPH